MVKSGVETVLNYTCRSVIWFAKKWYYSQKKFGMVYCCHNKHGRSWCQMIYWIAVSLSNLYSNLWRSLTVRVIRGIISHRWGTSSGTTSNDIACPVIMNAILWWVYIRMLAEFNGIESCHTWIEEYDLAGPPFEATAAQLDWGSASTFRDIMTFMSWIF